MVEAASPVASGDADDGKSGARTATARRDGDGGVCGSGSADSTYEDEDDDDLSDGDYYGQDYFMLGSPTDSDDGETPEIPQSRQVSERLPSLDIGSESPASHTVPAEEECRTLPSVTPEDGTAPAIPRRDVAPGEADDPRSLPPDRKDAASHIDGASAEVPRIADAQLAKENRRLRKRRKELLDHLSRLAREFASREKEAARALGRLERENARLRTAPPAAVASRAPEAAPTRDERDGVGNNEGAGGKKYDEELVKRLSRGVLQQEQQLRAKDEAIARLTAEVVALRRSSPGGEHGGPLREKSADADGDGMPSRETALPPTATRGRGARRARQRDDARLARELEGARATVAELTQALETSNATLDAAVLKVETLQKWKAEHKGAAAAAAAAAAEARDVAAEEWKSELEATKEEATWLRRELERSRACEVGDLQEAPGPVADGSAAATGGTGDAPHETAAVEREAGGAGDSSHETVAPEREAAHAGERLRQLEAQLAARENEICRLRTAATATSSPARPDGAGRIRSGSAHGPSAAPDGPCPPVLEKGRLGLGPLRRAFSARPAADPAAEEPTDLPALLKQRDVRIASLDARASSYQRVIDGLKDDAERARQEREKAARASSLEIERLREENETFQTQVRGYETAFMNLNEKRAEGKV